MSQTRTIKVKVLASSDLKEIKSEVYDLLLQLNRSFESFGIVFAMANESADVNIDEINIIIYWRDFGECSEPELNSAYESLKKGGNPKKIYVFFREPSEGLDEAMRAFKESFDKKYSHFYCTFEHVDSLRFELATQCLLYLPSNKNKDLITLNDDGKIVLFGNDIANIENLPFAKLNFTRNDLVKQIADTENRINNLEETFRDNPDDEINEALQKAQKQLDDLKEDLKRYNELLFSRAVFFAQESARNSDEKIAKARKLFEQGRVREANKVLDLSEMIERDKNDAKLYENVRQVRIKNIHEFHTKALIVLLNEDITIEERFKQACEAYDNVIRIANEISYLEDDLGKMTLEYARLLEDFKEFNEAERIYKLTVSIYSKLDGEGKDNYADDIARLYNFLAVLHTKLNRFSDAEEDYKKALEIVSRLAEKEKAYVIRVCQTLSNLSMLHATLKKYEEAEREVTFALNNMRKVNDFAPGLFTNDIAASLLNLSGIHLNLHKFDLAEKELTESVSIRRDLYKKLPEKYFTDFSISLNNLAYLHETLGKLNEAEREYLEVVQVLETLNGRNAISTEVMLADVLQNLAIVHEKLRKYENAEQEIGKAIDIFLRLVKSNPNPYKSNLARALHNRSTLFHDMGKLKEAEEDQENSLAYYSELIVDYPDLYLEYYADSLTHLAKIHVELSLAEKAMKEYESALLCFRRLAKINPEQFEERVANVIGEIIYLRRQTNQLDNIEDLFNEKIKIYQRLFNKGNNSCKDKLAFSLLELAHFHFCQKKFDEAESEWKEGLSILRSIVENNPSLYDYQSCIAISMLRLGDISFAGNRFNEAEERYSEALNIFKKLLNVLPNMAGNVAQSLDSLISTHIHLSKLNEAKEELQLLIAILENHEKMNPGSVKEIIEDRRALLDRINDVIQK